MKKTNFLIILAVLVILSGCGTSTYVSNNVLDLPEDNNVEDVAEIQIEKPEETNKVEVTPSDAEALDGKEEKIINKDINQEKIMDKKISYSAILHTSEGDIKVKLNDDQTPKTVENFVTLAKKDFYNGTIFHRVIKDFMIQGGDPTGTGAGGPGYKFDDEEFEGEYERGTLAMANAGPDTNGSQFFIMHADVALPKNYTIFGKVEEGLEVVDKIAKAEVEMSMSGEPSKPVEPVILESVEIIEN